MNPENSSRDVPRQRNGSQLTREHVFSLLSNRRRRYVFYSLEREGGTTTIGDLATRIAAWESGVAVEDVSSKRRKVAYNALQQSHLPRLADRGLVVYDRETGTVERTERGERVGRYLKMVPGRDRRWSRLYLAIAGGACSIALALVVDVPLVSSVPAEAWFTVLAVALFAVAAVNVSAQRTEWDRYDERPPEPDEPGGTDGIDEDG